jgi:hypothetical protein
MLIVVVLVLPKKTGGRSRFRVCGPWVSTLDDVKNVCWIHEQTRVLSPPTGTAGSTGIDFVFEPTFESERVFE